MIPTLKISIITPCRNVVDYIDDTVESVIRQKGDFSIEYIVVDGASNDGTLEYLKKVEQSLLRDRAPGMPLLTFRLISEPDRGMYDALVKGLRLATGDIIAYLNGDDFYLPGAFSTVAEIFTSFPDVHWLAGMATWANAKSGICYTNPEGGFCQKLISKGFHGRILRVIPQENVFFRRTLLKEVDLDRLGGLKYAGDFFLWKSFSSKAGLFQVVAWLACYRGRPGQITADLKKYYSEFDALVDKKNFVDWSMALLFCIVQHTFPFWLKKRLNKRIIQYAVNQQAWVCENKGRI